MTPPWLTSTIERPSKSATSDSTAATARSRKGPEPSPKNMWSHLTSRVKSSSRAAHSSGGTRACGSTPGSSSQYDFT